MPRIIRLLVLFCALSPAKAAFIYDYVGTPFTFVFGPWQGTPTRITASVTLAEALPSGSDTFFGTYFYGGSSIDLSPELLAWSISDGVRTITGPGDGGLRFLIDDFGGISGWDMSQVNPGILSKGTLRPNMQ